MDIFSRAELTSSSGNTHREKENQQFDLQNAALGQDEAIMWAGWVCEGTEEEEEGGRG